MARVDIIEGTLAKAGPDGGSAPAAIVDCAGLHLHRRSRWRAGQRAPSEIQRFLGERTQHAERVARLKRLLWAARSCRRKTHRGRCRVMARRCAGHRIYVQPINYHGSARHRAAAADAIALTRSWMIWRKPSIRYGRTPYPRGLGSSTFLLDLYILLSGYTSIYKKCRKLTMSSCARPSFECLCREESRRWAPASQFFEPAVSKHLGVLKKTAEPVRDTHIIARSLAPFYRLDKPNDRLFGKAGSTNSENGPAQRTAQ